MLVSPLHSVSEVLELVKSENDGKKSSWSADAVRLIPLSKKRTQLRRAIEWELWYANNEANDDDDFEEAVIVTIKNWLNG